MTDKSVEGRIEEIICGVYCIGCGAKKICLTCEDNNEGNVFTKDEAKQAILTLITEARERDETKINKMINNHRIPFRYGL